MTFDLERLYQLYPRKMGKTVGMKKAKAQVKTLKDYDDLESAIKRFAAYLRAKGTEPQYIPYFQTFMTSWRDWLDPDAGRVTLTQAPQPAAPKIEEESWAEADPKRVREILDMAMRGKSSYAHGRAETQEGLADDLEKTGSDDCD